jgi:SAM-dependent methyltransferase
MSQASSTTREAWATQLEARARAHWTPARTRELTRGKDLAVLPGEAPVLLRALGLLAMDGSLPPPQVRKYLQINHMVKLLRPSIEALGARHEVVRLLDAGCGRSYLTLLLAWCAKEKWGHRLEVLGVDRNPALIAECERRTALAELSEVVTYLAAPLEAVAGRELHGVFALHACDTATCDAIALGVAAKAELIAVAPCCHAELARGWARLVEQNETARGPSTSLGVSGCAPGAEPVPANPLTGGAGAFAPEWRAPGAEPVPANPLTGGAGAFGPVWRAPHLRRELAVHLTDTLRTLLLRAAGYEVTAMEFIGSEHTKKNTLLRATLRGAPDPTARAEYEALVAATGGCGLALAARLRS